LTAFHAEYSRVPKNWVHIVFQDYAPGNGFTAGEVAATVALTLLMRTGRSPDYKRGMLTRLWELQLLQTLQFGCSLQEFWRAERIASGNRLGPAALSKVLGVMRRHEYASCNNDVVPVGMSPADLRTAEELHRPGSHGGVSNGLSW